MEGGRMNIRVLVLARRAHAPIEYAVMSASGADGHVDAKPPACLV